MIYIISYTLLLLEYRCMISALGHNYEGREDYCLQCASRAFGRLKIESRGHSTKLMAIGMLILLFVFKPCFKKNNCLPIAAFSRYQATLIHVACTKSSKFTASIPRPTSTTLTPKPNTFLAPLFAFPTSDSQTSLFHALSREEITSYQRGKDSRVQSKHP